MNYKDEMRKLIDLVKQQSFDAPLESTLDDMNMLTTAVSDLSDRITLRVSKSLQPNHKKAKASVKKKSNAKLKAFPSVTPLPIPQSKTKNTSDTKQQTISNPKDELLAKQIAVQSIKPQASI
ncbi:hypothetical protein ABXT60_02420 [Candidatus Njordibacter sp. Uisw_056]|uniref:hypothetical protein n=1 Tax=Candidatus Njordibacter sp. Uisw_056 TaxID=3230973 RepID=UPI003D445B75